MQNINKKVLIKKCSYCGKKFETTKNNKKYCSKKCEIKNKLKLDKRKKNRKYEKICNYCGKLFMANKKTNYCSDECSKKAKQDYDANYYHKKYYNDNQYKQRKLENTVGTFNMQSNLNTNGERDWDKEYKMIQALKGKAGIK